jgi:hypothetical protein
MSDEKKPVVIQAYVEVQTTIQFSVSVELQATEAEEDEFYKYEGGEVFGTESPVVLPEALHEMLSKAADPHNDHKDRQIPAWVSSQIPYEAMTRNKRIGIRPKTATNLKIISFEPNP